MKFILMIKNQYKLKCAFIHKYKCVKNKKNNNIWSEGHYCISSGKKSWGILCKNYCLHV